MDRQQHSDREQSREPWEESWPPRRQGHRGGAVLFGVFLGLIALSVGLYVFLNQLDFRSVPDYRDNWTIPVPTYGTEDSELEEPERAPVGTGVTMGLSSAEGKAELTYQELYRRCAPGVVSVRVENRTGAYLGSGIVMTEDGYIVTNCHVVEDCHTVSVSLEDGRKLNALLVGKDAQTDLAVLKVEAEGLPALEFGSSDELEVGDPVLTIGNPLGEQLRGTLTDGIVSAINRDITMNGYGMTLLQTTAAVNQGNSGGPVLNIYGQVVGVVNMKMMSSYSTIEGLGFAIPTTVAEGVVNELIERGYVSRAVLGISCYAVEADALEREDFEGGLYVAEITPGSRAGDAGLEEGDIIVEANGVPIRAMEDMAAVRDGLGVGDIISMTVFRDETETLTVDVPLCDQRDLR